jgi:nitric oxide reductase large subunit
MVSQLHLVIAHMILRIIADNFHQQVPAIPHAIVTGMKTVLMQKNDVWQANLPRTNPKPNPV